MLSELEEAVPLGAAWESHHIKMEPEEPHPEGVPQGHRAQGAQSRVPLSQGSKEKALFLPGGGEERKVGRGASWVAAVGRGGGSAPVEWGRALLPWSGGDAQMSAHLPSVGCPRTAYEPAYSSWVRLGWSLRQPWVSLEDQT